MELPYRLLLRLNEVDPSDSLSHLFVNDPGLVRLMLNRRRWSSKGSLSVMGILEPVCSLSICCLVLILRTDINHAARLVLRLLLLLRIWPVLLVVIVGKTGRVIGSIAWLASSHIQHRWAQVRLGTHHEGAILIRHKDKLLGLIR